MALARVRPKVVEDEVASVISDQVADSSLVAYSWAATVSWLDMISAGAAIATILGVPIALLAVTAGARQLQSQAKSQALSAILETNTLWADVSASQTEVTLSAQTVREIILGYDVLGAPLESVLKGAPEGPIAARTPFILGALLPVGLKDPEDAPQDSDAYNDLLVERAIAVGYTLNRLRLRCIEGSDTHSPEIADDVKALEHAVEGWVNRLNEVAELYGEDLIDRRLFIGKRHVALAQQAFFAEPYVLWRNTMFSGRWGVRLLALGQEARRYHWTHPLQTSSVMGRLDPEGFGLRSDYDGLMSRVGWMFGPDRTDHTMKHAERLLGTSLGSAFDGPSRSQQNALIGRLPIAERQASGKDAGRLRWEEVVPAPDGLTRAIIQSQQRKELS
jgi:hypothetical protein